MEGYEPLPLDLPLAEENIIKVIGVGGGGNNAVNHMFRQGIKDVSFVVCNTDNQALIKSPIPTKIQLGKNTTDGLGAGNRPEKAREAAEESIDRIKEVLSDNTRMVFITAGMGGGTGTGASPVVARVAHEMNILTVGIVTIPFAFEGAKKIRQAMEGVAQLSQHVDAILVINNEKLRKIYPDLEISNAFAKADDVLTNAAKAIAEIITIPGYINTDFADVYTILKDGNVAIMNTGYAAGEDRITNAIQDALTSPLVNTSDITGASKILLSFYCSNEHQIRMEEVEQIHKFMATVGENVEVIWGATFDDTLGEQVKVTIIATGFAVSSIPGMPAKQSKETETDKANPDAGQQTDSQNTEKNAPPTVDEAIKEFYGKQPTEKTETAQETPENEETTEEIPVISIDDIDWENDDELNSSIEIPAWKRKMQSKQ